MIRLNLLGQIILAILIIGGINWGLIALFDFDIIAAIFGELSAISRILYGIVGISALYMLYVLIRSMAD